MHSCIGCICTTFLQCEFSNVFSNRLSEEMRSRIGWIWTIFLQKVALAAFERLFSRVKFQMSSLIACQNRCIVTLVAFEWLVSSVSFQIFSQIVWVNRCKVALVAYERFFSRVSFQMSSQIACQNRCIVALVAFRWLFPVWVFKCFLKSSEWRDAMSHWLNLNDF